MSWLVSRRKKCRTCRGKKVIPDSTGKDIPCPTCKGTGQVISPSMT